MRDTPYKYNDRDRAEQAKRFTVNAGTILQVGQTAADSARQQKNLSERPSWVYEPGTYGYVTRPGCE